MNYANVKRDALKVSYFLQDRPYQSQSCFALDADGKDCYPESPFAHSFGIYGAMRLLLKNDSERAALFGMLKQIAINEGFNGPNPLEEWEVGRTKDEALQILQAVIAGRWTVEEK